MTPQPPITDTFDVAFPDAGIMLVTINRPRHMNAIPLSGHQEGSTLFDWFDSEPSLIVAIITGAGSKAFCAGADLLEQRTTNQKASQQQQALPTAGFAGLTRREGKKPVIAAVNGFALGGGFEMCLNCDIVLASPQGTFALPEVQRGLYAGAGGLSRAVRIAGILVASELALTGRRLTAQEAKEHRFVNSVAQTPDSLMTEALGMAKTIASRSPDAIIVTRHGLREALESGSVERASQRTEQRYAKALMASENLRIGLEAFAAKKEPKWVASRL